MTPEAIAAILANRKAGTIFTVHMERAVKTLKKCQHSITKKSEYQGQLCEYGRTKSVREGVEEKLRDVPHLPKGAKRAFYHGRVKFFEMMNGNVRLACPVTGNTPKVQFFRDGKPVEKREIADDILASELQEHKSRQELAELNQSPFVMVGCKNIVEIH